MSQKHHLNNYSLSVQQALTGNSRNVKRWRPGDQIERWEGSGLLVAERQFRKVRGFREIPLLLASLANTVSRKPLTNQAAAA